MCVLTWLAVAVIPTSALYAASEQTSILAPLSPPAFSIREMILLVTAIAVAILLIVEGVLLYSLFRFRARRADDTDEPPQVYGSGPIEIAWTTAPALVVFVLILVIIRTVTAVGVDPSAPPPGAQPLYVTVIAHQWWWEYIYDEYHGRTLGFVTANELHVPQSEEGTPRPVYLTLRSADVCHSFWVPRLAGKTDLIPGRVNRMWFQTAQRGLLVGQCAEYCGTQHANMLLRVVVDAPEDFERWLEHQAKPAVAAPEAQEARALFLSQSCVNCHTVRGTDAHGKFGPDLTHLMSRQTLGAGIVANAPEHLLRWITDPQQAKPGCLMPAFGLGRERFAEIARYLETLE